MIVKPRGGAHGDGASVMWDHEPKEIDRDVALELDAHRRSHGAHLRVHGDLEVAVRRRAPCHVHPEAGPRRRHHPSMPRRGPLGATALGIRWRNNEDREKVCERLPFVFSLPTSRLKPRKNAVALLLSETESSYLYRQTAVHLSPSVIDFSEIKSTHW